MDSAVHLSRGEQASFHSWHGVRIVLMFNNFYQCLNFKCLVNSVMDII